MEMTEFNVAYDRKIFDPGIQTLYKGKRFYNVGDWSANPNDIVDACRALVKRHLFLISEGDIAPKTILDAGCGLGAGTELIAEQFPDAAVTGLNISEQQIRECIKNGGRGVNYRVMDAAFPEFPNESFDLITSVEAVFHFNTRRDFLRNCNKLLQPGGHLIFSDILFFDTTFVGDWSVPEENKIVDIDEYNLQITDCGFSIIVQEDITEVSWNPFCDHVSSFQGMKSHALGLRKSVAYYLITKLQKPFR
jgi:MPBQ/MSBQ methyltransferase